MPKTIRWIGICAILMLVFMSCYRLGIYWAFSGTFSDAKSYTGQAAGYGFLFDARWVAIASLFMFLLSFWPRLHFFKWKEGKKMAVVIYGILFFFLVLLYAADVAYLHSFGQRLQGSLISDTAKGTEKWQVYKTGNMWWLLLLVIAMLTWSFIVAIIKAHKAIHKTRSRDNSGARLFWQILLAVICGIAIYGNIGRRPLSASALSGTLAPSAWQLSLNPFESSYYSLPVMSRSTEKPVDNNEP